MGSTCKGMVRFAEYVKEYGDMIHIFSVIDLDNIPQAVQTKVTFFLLRALEGFIPRKFPVTIKDCIRMEMEGLPLYTQLFFWSMVKSIEECTILGGALELKSNLRRLIANVAKRPRVAAKCF